MCNKVITGMANKISNGGTTTGWRYVYSLSKASAQVADEAMTGTADGVNTKFYMAQADITDTDGNSATTGDITIKDDAVSATVASIDSATGIVTMSAAPANGSVMTATYYYAERSAHKEVVVDAGDMTNKEDAAEAKTKADIAAGATRTTWLASVAAESTKTAQVSHEGNVTL